MRIEERAVRRLAGVRVAVGNLWRRPRATGLDGPAAMFWVGDAAPLTCWEGDELEVGGRMWVVDRVQPGPGTTGHVVVREA